jgi:hypothetical protein
MNIDLSRIALLPADLQLKILSLGSETPEDGIVKDISTRDNESTECIVPAATILQNLGTQGYFIIDDFLPQKAASEVLEHVKVS